MRGGTFTIRQFLDAQKASDLFIIDRRSIYGSFVLVAVAFGLVFLQPFGLNEVGWIQRIAYWTFICVCGYCLYGSTFLFGGRILAKTSLELSYPLSIIIFGFVASVLMSFVVIFSGYVFFDFRGPYTNQFLVIFPQTLIIGAVLLVVTVAIDFMGEQNKLLQADQASDRLHSQAVTAFLQNIPVRLRGEILCLETEDHYLRVHTDRGQHLFLMRMKDAVAILEGARGLQVHRSWWVAENAVCEARRDGRKISLVLKNDIVVPVSRKFSSDVRARNLLK